MKNLKSLAILTFCTLIVISCKISKDITGEYKSNDLGKWHLNIEKNNVFHFIGEDYLALLTKNEPYIYTVGTWVRNGDTLILSSKQDKPEISRTKTYETTDSLSAFIFFNSYGDTVTFNTINKNQELFMTKVHGSNSKFRSRVEKNDIFEFIFFGYEPFVIKIEDPNPKIYKITLARQQKSNYFDKHFFKIKNKGLIDIKKNKRYKKSNHSTNT